MEYIYPFMDKLEPILKEYGYNLDLNSKLSIVALHKDYYIKDRQLIMKIRQLLSYATELKYVNKTLYVGKIKVEDANLKYDFLEDVRDRIERTLFPESYETEIIERILFEDFDTELHRLFNDDAEFCSRINLDEFTHNHIESIKSFQNVRKFLDMHIVAIPDHGVSKFLNLGADAALKTFSICTKMMIMQAMVFIELYSNSSSVTEDLKLIYDIASENKEKLEAIFAEDPQYKQCFIDFIIWKVKQETYEDDLSNLEETVLKEKVDMLIKDLLSASYNSLIQEIKGYISIHEMELKTKNEIYKICKTFFENEDKTSWQNKRSGIDKFLNTLEAPLIGIIYNYFTSRMINTLNPFLSNSSVERKTITTIEIFEAYKKSIEEKLNKFYERKPDDLNDNNLKSKRNAKKESSTYGINYALAAQYIYSILTGNIISAKDLGTTLKQEEGAAVYDILDALGYQGPALNEDEFKKPDKAKFQAIRPCFRLEKSGGYNILKFID